MEITLSCEEVREALRSAMEDKINRMFGAIHEDNCYMKVVAPGGEIDDIEEITFTAVIEGGNQ